MPAVGTNSYRFLVHDSPSFVTLVYVRSRNHLRSLRKGNLRRICRARSRAISIRSSRRIRTGLRKSQMRQSQANQVFRLPLEREPKVGFVSCSLWLFEALSETLPVSESLIGIWQRFGTNGPFGVGPDPTLLSPGAILKIILSRRTFIWFCLNGGSDRELTQLGRLPGQPNGITVWLSQRVQTEGKPPPCFTSAAATALDRGCRGNRQ